MFKNLRARLVTLALLWLALIGSAQGVRAESAPSREPKTVADFFLLAPEHVIGYDLPFRQELLRGERRGAVIDIWRRSLAPGERVPIHRDNPGITSPWIPSPRSGRQSQKPARKQGQPPKTAAVDLSLMLPSLTVGLLTRIAPLQSLSEKSHRQGSKNK